jgi:hypothetical protein
MVVLPFYESLCQNRIAARPTTAMSHSQPDLLALIDQAHAEQWETLNLDRMGLTELPPKLANLPG